MRVARLPPGHGLLPGNVRFTGIVTEAGKADGPIWIDVPEALSAAVTERLDAWLLWVLPHAFETQQDVVLEGRVDSELLRNAHDLMEIWSRWRPDRRPIRVRAEPAAEANAGQGPVRTGLFFSGGVDSFFSLFHHDEMVREHPEWRERPVDDLVYVDGFDIPLEATEALAAKRVTLERIATDTGKTLIVLATNLRQTGVKQLWGRVMHGPALGGVGLLLGNLWKTAMLSAWCCYEDTDPWGSTALTDPYFTASATRTRHYGGGHDRFDKLAFLVRFPIVLDTLHVCWQERSEGNCGQCEKCLRTLVALDVLGARERAATFPQGPLDLSGLAEACKGQPLFFRTWPQLKDHAARAGRADIASAIDACLTQHR